MTPNEPDPTEEVPMGGDDHHVGNAPPGAILRCVPDLKEGAVEDMPNTRPDKQFVRDWIDPTTGETRRVGNAEAAGQLCVTPRSPKGIGGHQYRRMVNKPPVTFDPPPGPIMVQGMLLTEMVPRWRPPYTDKNGVYHEGRDIPRREALYDLDEVAAWNARRPGHGKRGKWRSRQGRARAEAAGESELARTG